MNILLAILAGAAFWMIFFVALLRFLGHSADRNEQSAEDAADSVRAKINELEPQIKRVRAGVNHE